MLFCFFVVRGLLWSALIPPFQAPDEQAHFGGVYDFYINNSNPWSADRREDMRTRSFAILAHAWDQYIRHYGRRSFAAESKLGPNEEEIRRLPPDMGQHKVSIIVQHPPFYYLFGAVVLWCLPTGNPIVQLFAVRVLSVSLGIGALVFVYLTARELFPGRERWQTYAVIVFAFLPMATFLTSAVNPDSYGTFGACFFLWAIVRWTGRQNDRTAVYWLAASLVVATTTKKSIYFVFPFTFVVVVVTMLMRRRWMWRDTVVLIPAFLFFFFFYSSYPGFRDYTLEKEMGVRNQPIRPVGWREMDIGGEARIILWKKLAEYWGEFGWGETRYPGSVYIFLGVITYLSMALCIVALTLRKPLPVRRPQLVLLLGYTVTVFAGVLAMNLIFLHKTGGMYAHGRHLLSAWFPQALCLLIGFSVFAPKRYRELPPQVVCLLMIALNILGLFAIVVPRYSL